MKEKLNKLRALANRKAMAASVALLPVLSFAQTVDDPGTKITESVTTITGLVAIAGAGMVGVALAMVGWSVAVKFIKRMKGAA